MNPWVGVGGEWIMQVERICNIRREKNGLLYYTIDWWCSVCVYSYTLIRPVGLHKGDANRISVSMRTSGLPFVRSFLEARNHTSELSYTLWSKIIAHLSHINIHSHTNNIFLMFSTIVFWFCYSVIDNWNRSRGNNEMERYSFNFWGLKLSLLINNVMDYETIGFIYSLSLNNMK